jgi:hypothetical protein
MEILQKKGKLEIPSVVSGSRFSAAGKRRPA